MLGRQRAARDGSGRGPWASWRRPARGWSCIRPIPKKFPRPWPMPWPVRHRRCPQRLAQGRRSIRRPSARIASVGHATTTLTGPASASTQIDLRAGTGGPGLIEAVAAARRRRGSGHGRADLARSLGKWHSQTDAADQPACNLPNRLPSRRCRCRPRSWPARRPGLCACTAALRRAAMTRVVELAHQASPR